MTEQSSSVGDRFDYETIRSTSKLLLGAVSLVVLVVLLSVLPGIDLVVPQTPITLLGLVGAIAAFVIAGLLLVAAPKLARVVHATFDEPDPAGEHAGAIVYWLTVLVAVLVVHRGLAGVVVPFLEDAVWLYDAAFLVIGLIPVVVIAARAYAALDPLADLIASEVAGGDADDRGSEGSDADQPKVP